MITFATLQKLFKATVFLLLCLLLASALLLHLPDKANSAEEAAASPRVLILNSYHHGYTWSDRELDGILESFDASGLKADISVEYLDSKHYPKNEHFEQLKALLAVKYGKDRPALVMALDNPAFEFAINYRQKLFAGIPIVFAGLNDFEPSMLKGKTGITGIVERQDIIGTVKLARLLQPKVREIVILHDFTSSGLASRKEAEEQLAPLANEFIFRYLPDMTIAEIVSTLKKLGSDSAVLPFSYSRDKSGEVFTHAELTRKLAENSAVPIYGTKEERLGYGIIGGSLLEGRNHGALAAGLALRVLRGESAAAIPVVTEPQTRLMFDNNVLEKFRINPKRLPAGSILLNSSPGFYRAHAVVINVAGGIILLLAGGLAFVIVANRRRIRAEEALIEAERGRSRVLEAANREMESFCYAVSHDLQAPLRHINSFSSIIEEEYGDRLDAGGIAYFSRLKSATVRMSNLISDLLTLSQISTFEINRQEFDLGELAGEVFAELQLHENSRDIRITIDKGLCAFADKKLVGVVLDNLIGNAWKYTAKTPAALIHLGSMTEDNRQIFFIADNGAGFDMQYAFKLFSPFQRLHTKAEFEGSGVGLATVQRIINRHGGEIWAKGEPGKGATFFFTLQP